MQVAFYLIPNNNSWYNSIASRNALEEVCPGELAKRYSPVWYALNRIIDTIMEIALKTFSTDYTALKSKYVTHYLTEKAKHHHSKDGRSIQSTHSTFPLSPTPVSYEEEEVIEGSFLQHFPPKLEQDPPLTEEIIIESQESNKTMPALHSN